VDGLAMLAQEVVKQNPYSGHMFAFRGKRADRIKILWWDGTGMCLYAKRLERGRFIWPMTQEGTATLTPAQLSMLCEGIDWACADQNRRHTARRLNKQCFVCL
jgi:transposase